MAQISVQNLTLGYEGKPIVSGLDFEVEAGDYLCIVGENGSGKSTLVKTLLGLTAPLSGTITFGDGLKKNEIGYLPQHAQVQQDFPASVREIVLSGFAGKHRFLPFRLPGEKKEARENMARLGIEDLADASFSTLSGGQKQRVLLARALCATKKALLLDEPVAGLDPNVTQELYRVIRDLNEEGITILMISHDVHEAVRYADHVLHIGKEVWYGPRDAYLKMTDWYHHTAEDHRIIGRPPILAGIDLGEGDAETREVPQQEEGRSRFTGLYQEFLKAQLEGRLNERFPGNEEKDD
ncbi:MAG: metal ABC transporter ATP-binding protein [Lachnospiraceae bacterium]|nr:metal ABC transporter ATP-binding protein [Lachnospiraceae bacterium]